MATLLLDIGASSLKYKALGAPVDEARVFDFPQSRPSLEQFCGWLEDLGLATYARWRVAVPGLVDEGRLTLAANLGWRDLDLISVFESRWAISVERLVSDAAAVASAALAELPDLGARRRALVLVWGTGVGGAEIHGSELVRAQGVAHRSVPEGRPCVLCGAESCFEPAFAMRQFEGALQAQERSEWRRLVRLLMSFFEDWCGQTKTPVQLWLAGGPSAVDEFQRQLKTAWVASFVASGPAAQLCFAKQGRMAGLLGLEQLS